MRDLESNELSHVYGAGGAGRKPFDGKKHEHFSKKHRPSKKHKTSKKRPRKA